ncbi:MAG: guanine deaminase [Gammaproteobacteria bacterium]|jgi:guanine deaminase
MMYSSAHRGRILHLLRDPHDGDESSFEYFDDGLLLIDVDGRVIELGPYPDLVKKISSEIRITNHGRKLLVPGFVDTHIHFAQSGVIASYGTQLLDWLERYTFPAEMRCEDMAHAANLAEFFIQQLLKNGTTTAMVFGTVHPQSVEAFFKVCEPLNLRMICGKVLMDRHAPPALCDNPDQGYRDSAALIEKWHGKGRLGYAVTPRFAPTSSDEQLKKAGELIKHYPGVFMQTHLSENVRECEWVSELFPKSQDYLDVYEQAGLLGSRSVFAHGIHLSDREWQALSATHSSISFCPCSNLFIGSGLFNLHQADHHQVQVSLGSDVGGGDSFSMLRVMNEAYKVQQLQGHNLHPLRALYLATLGGARSLELDDVIGNFQVGKEADFVVLDPNATDLLAHRTSGVEDIEELLFAMLMLGDDRIVSETWSMGNQVWALPVSENSIHIG